MDSAFIWRRIAAQFYDLLLIMALWFVMTAAILLWRDGAPIPEGAWWYQLMLLGVVVGFYWLFWLKSNGQTLGMKTWRIRLCADEGSLTSRKILIRLAAGMGLWGLCLLSVWWRTDRRPLHDVFSHTHIERT